MVDERSIAEVAQVCHEVNRAYCASLGDTSHLPWPEAPEWQKKSAIEGVRLHLKNEATTPEESHASWLAAKVADGWVFGLVKDPEKKEHPCMVPYEKLPQEQRTKDYLFKGVMSAIHQMLKEGEVDA